MSGAPEGLAVLFLVGWWTSRGRAESLVKDESVPNDPGRGVLELGP